MNAIIASLALLGTTVAASSLSVGTAHVVNKCNYDVYLCNVPSADGGYSEEDKTLAAGESWEQTWTSLTNGNGWSIKLSKSSSLENILQYEYTFHNDGIIWYDLSCVNGNPWDQDWEITATGDSCSPKQQAYRYATDDAYGMQSCPQDAAITVTLCTGVSADNGTAVDAGSSSSASAPSYESTTSASAPSSSATSAEATSEASAPSYESSTTSSKKASWTGAPWYNWNNKDASASANAEVTPTTFATQTTAVVTDGAAGVTITQVETAVVTNYVTAYAHRHRRHADAHAHQQHA